MNLEDKRAIENFAEIARRFCSWVEGPANEAILDLRLSRQLLTELHLAVIKLPVLDIEDKTDTAPDAMSLMKIRERFGKFPFDGYWDVFDPLSEEKSVFNSLVDDLADIYHDLINGLYFFDSGNITEAVWEWSFHFNIHWGAHLVGSQRAIHAYLSEMDA